MRTRDADILMIPGIGGSGPEHWQSRWQAKLPTARRVVQDDWDRPELHAWSRPIIAAITEAERPVVLVAHSLGVVAAVHVLAMGGAGRVVGAFLVCPPSEACIAAMPAIAADFRPFPSGPLPCPATTVGSTDDPYCDLDTAERMASLWGASFLNAGAAGHINTESGHGPWPEGLLAFAGFLSKLG